MNNMLVHSLLELPPEILHQIGSLLSKQDLSVCVQVSKDWYHAYMDNLWHTVELKDKTATPSNGRSFSV